MAKVVVNRENFKVDEIELEQGTLTVGRSEDNDLHIDDLTVSGRHAKIVTVFGSTYVEDLDSTNGSFVNGKRIKTHTLHNGDVLTIGHYQLLFQGETPDNPHAGNDQTRMINPSQIAALSKSADVRHHQAEQRARPAVAPANPAPVAPVAEAVSPPPAEERVVAMSTASPLPDIDDAVDLDDAPLAKDEKAAEPHTEQRMPRMRRGDVSPSTALKTMVLAALTAAATFMLMMLIFDL